MAGFGVVTERVAAQALTLDALGGELRGACSYIAAVGDAASGTDAAGALGEATAVWIEAIGQFSHATSAMAAAVALAAECYAVTDETAIPGG
jgi:hypothetical protein